MRLAQACTETGPIKCALLDDRDRCSSCLVASLAGSVTCANTSGTCRSISVSIVNSISGCSLSLRISHHFSEGGASPARAGIRDPANTRARNERGSGPMAPSGSTPAHFVAARLAAPNDRAHDLTTRQAERWSGMLRSARDDDSVRRSVRRSTPRKTGPSPGAPAAREAPPKLQRECRRGPAGLERGQPAPRSPRPRARPCRRKRR